MNTIKEEVEQRHHDEQQKQSSVRVLHHMGISKELDTLQKGKSIWKKVKKMITMDGEDKKVEEVVTMEGKEEQEKEIEIIKIANQPPIFHLKNILSNDECHYIQSISTEYETFEKAVTRLGGDDNEKRKKCDVAWLSNFKYDPLATLADTVQSLFLPFEPSPIRLEHLEEMQVVKYETDGEFKLHHDGARRILTVIYYVNGVSETWFPLADCGRRIESYEEAMEMVERIVETKGVGRDGVLVTSKDQSFDDDDDDKRKNTTASRIERGDAIAFYNYFHDASVDFNAFHAGLPAESEKWIATHWYHHVPRSAL